MKNKEKKSSTKKLKTVQNCKFIWENVGNISGNDVAAYTTLISKDTTRIVIKKGTCANPKFANFKINISPDTATNLLDTIETISKDWDLEYVGDQGIAVRWKMVLAYKDGSKRKVFGKGGALPIGAREIIDMVKKIVDEHSIDFQLF